MVRPEDQRTDAETQRHYGGVPLRFGGEPLAWLRFSYRCRLDRDDDWLAISESSEWVTAEVDRLPLLRFDYRRDATTEPSAHVQVHAHRGAMSHLLSRANVKAPHDMSTVRVPTGGARFRTCLADVVQMLVTQMGVDAKDGWQEAVEANRFQYRTTQVGAIVRAQPGLAAAQLERMGYRITPPAEGPREVHRKALTAW